MFNRTNYMRNYMRKLHKRRISLTMEEQSIRIKKKYGVI